ncbi:MAG TPA: hypothetical protein VGL86_27405 [Polyangia bacterium]|jgi:hypothetical protein
MGNFNLVNRFSDAGLPLQLAAEPIARAAAAELVFQVDIRRRRPWDSHSEYYVAWPGGGDNVVVVQGVDKRQRQLVMMVHEPQHWFWEEVPPWTARVARKSAGWRESLAKQARVEVKDVVWQGEQVWVRRSTDARKRHFLVGRDERQLFMCRLPRACTTVAEAHEALRVPAARLDARSVLERAIRQGEWFFVPAEPEVEARLEDELGRGVVERHRGVAISRFIPRPGKPHIVDELLDARDAAGNREVYARGRVRHPDHRTVRLYRWYRVFRNREVEEGRSPFGGGWID